jgi:hypothetical protein
MRTRREAIENLEYLISGECCDSHMDYIEEIEMAITDMKICDANNAGWISVKDRMPESKTCVLVTVKTRNGKHVVMIACHVNAREVDSEDYEWQDAEID